MFIITQSASACKAEIDIFADSKKRRLSGCLELPPAAKGLLPKVPASFEAGTDSDAEKSLTLGELSGGSGNMPGACFPARPQRLCREDAAVRQEIYLLEN